MQKFAYTAVGLFLGVLVGVSVQGRRPPELVHDAPPHAIEIYHAGTPAVAETLRVVSVSDGRDERAVSDPRGRPRWTVRVNWGEGRIREYATESWTTP